jgi:two-component system phosphate regulon sensor histidine kinase PhoR
VKSRHFRFLALLGVLSILAVAVLQFFWFRQAFSTRKKEFELKVFESLHEVAEEIFAYNGQTNEDYYPIEQLSENYFVVMINDRIDLRLLDELLKREFQERYINTPYSYTIYDCANDNLVYGSNSKSLNKDLVLPKWNKDQYYFGVYFPKMRRSLFSGMEEWFLLSAVLLLVLVFFGFSLFVIFRQKRLTEVQRDFVNNMTHELKTPLSSIKLTSEALIKKPGMDDKSLQYLEIIGHESQKLQRQIENILQQAKGEKDGLELRKEKIEFGKFIRDILHRFNLSNTKKIEFNMELDDRSIEIRVDPLHMEHVFHNLLDNVAKYGTEKPKLNIKARRLRNQLIITWKDDGSGIPKKYRKRIFSPFFRIIERDTEEKEGFGLGLHYVKNVINAHKGKVRWVAQDESGYFEIILPLK